MAGRLAILAGDGSLPVELCRAVPDAVRVVFTGHDHQMPDPVLEHRIEQLGGMFAALRDAGVDRIVMGGSLIAPGFDPALLDDLMQVEAPGLMAAMAQGDDAVLRAVITLIEGQGFAVVGAHEVAPSLTPTAGTYGPSTPDAVAWGDIARAQAILAALGPLDVGQAAIVAGGRCLGIESVQGTEALLRFVAGTEPRRRPPVPGVLVKMPKPDQDLRADMPAIGPDTVHQCAAAGLGGIAVMAGQTLVLDRDAVMTALDDTGLFLLVQ